MKMSTEEIRDRFDNDVERFTNLYTGQNSTVDAALALDIIKRTAKAIHGNAETICDIGCGAGNLTLTMLEQFPGLECTLIDLSRNMLIKAEERIIAAGGRISAVHQADIRKAELPQNHYDLITAGAVLHHLRSRTEWKETLSSIFRALKPGGSFWMWDLITHENPAVQKIQWERYGRYLSDIKDDEYRDSVFAYIEKEDTPESVPYILKTMEETGFEDRDVLHKNVVFAAITALKPMTV